MSFIVNYSVDLIAGVTSLSVDEIGFIFLCFYVVTSTANYISKILDRDISKNFTGRILAILRGISRIIGDPYKLSGSDNRENR